MAGCAIAAHLAERGWKVSLLEKKAMIAGAASGNPAGLFKPQVNSEDNEITCYFNNYYQYFNLYLENLLEKNPSLQVSRGMYLNKQGEDLHNKGDKQATRFIQNAGYLSPAEFCTAQISNISNIKLITNCAVAKLTHSNGHWRCLSRHGKELSSSEILILANGVQLHEFSQIYQLPLYPLAGQITLLANDAISPRVSDAYAAKHYLIPMADRGYLCGATHHRKSSLSVSETDHYKNLDGIQTLIPNHSIDRSKIIRGRTGVRCVSPDHLPLVGAVPDYTYYMKHYGELHHGRRSGCYPQANYKKGLYLLGALGGHGIASSPYLAKLLCDIICGTCCRRETTAARLLHPGRFLIRELRRKPSDRKNSFT